MGLSHLFFRLTLYLAGGTLASLGVVRQTQLGRRYFLYHGLGALGLAVAAWLAAGRPAAGNGVALAAFLVLGTAFSVTAVARPRLSYGLLAGALASFTVAVVGDAGGLVPAVNALLSSGLLGFAMMAMLLGHWYLVQPKLAIEELGRVSLVLIALIVVRFFFGTAIVAQSLAPYGEAEIYRRLLGGSPGVFVLMRWTWGLFAPLVLSYLIWGTVKIRSTQSATGILYVTVLAVLTGECLGQYLTLYFGMPV